MVAMKLTDRDEVDILANEINGVNGLLGKLRRQGSEVHVCVLEDGERLDDARTIVISRETGLKLLDGHNAVLKDRLLKLGVVDDRPILEDASEEQPESLVVGPHDPGCAFMKTRLMQQPRPCDCTRSEVVE